MALLTHRRLIVPFQLCNLSIPEFEKTDVFTRFIRRFHVEKRV